MTSNAIKPDSVLRCFRGSRADVRYPLGRGALTMRTRLLVLFVLAATSALSGQTPATQNPAPAAPTPQQPSPRPTFRTGVDLLAVDATVVDRDGKQVTDLRPEEFSVEVDGDARPVVTADYVKLSDDTPIPIGAPKPGPPKPSPDEAFFSTNSKAASSGRLIVLVVDQGNIRVGQGRQMMRSAVKFKVALVKNPLVLVLDEPLNGADPVQRLRLIELFRRLGAEGRTVIVSSHVLHEVEAMAERVIVDRPRPAGGRRRSPRDPRRDGRRAPPACSSARPDGRRLAAALARPRGRRRASASTATTSSSRPPAPRSSPCCSPRPPATSACTSSRSARSTTRSRASSGSSCDERRRHARLAPAPAAARPRRLHAARLPAREALGRRADPRRGAPCSSGCSPRTVDDTAVRRVRRRRGRSPSSASSCR